MSENVNVFLEATRLNLTFDAQNHRNLTVNQLWQLPLQTTRATESSLEGAGKIVKKELRDLDEDSIVGSRSNPLKGTLELKLAVLIAIVEYKQAENAAKAQAKEREAEKATLRQLLLEKHAEELKGMSKEQIEARLKELGG